MSKKTCLLTALIAALACVLSIWGYVSLRWAWLLCVTGCAAMTLFLALVQLLRLSRAPRAGQQRVYRRKDTYISRAEWEFLHILRNLLPEYEVCPQAPLVAVVDKPGAAFRNELFRVVDYVVVEPISYKPLVLIELNDASHRRADRIERDRRVAEICADAGIPLVTFTAADTRDVPAVRKTLFSALRQSK